MRSIASPQAIGLWADGLYDPDGKPLSAGAWARHKDKWLPTAADQAFVMSLMHPVYAPGKIAGWIAAPDRGINHLPVENEYVRI